VFSSRRRTLAIPTIAVLMAACVGSTSPPPSTHGGRATGSTPVAVAGTLAPIATMSSPRAVQSSTRLEDGRVLIAGGCSDPGCELGSPAGSTAELFDPQTGSFTATGDLAGFRDDHVAVLLEDGRVLIAGGWGTDGVLATTEIYEPQSASFASGPEMMSTRAGFSGVGLDDGRVLLAGGFLDNEPTTAAAELFDPSDDSITKTGSLTIPRGAYAAARLEDGRVLIAGGLSRGKIVATAEIYDPRTERFHPTGAMQIPRYKAAAVTLRDGTVMVIGGASDVEGGRLFASTEIYDPRRGTFHAGPSMRWARYKLAGSVVPLQDGSILVAGGAPVAERYDPAEGRFEAVPGDLGGDRLFLAATAVGSAGVLLTGGYDGSIVPTDQAWIYVIDPER